MNIHNYTKYILYIQIHFFSSRARADKVNEVALSQSGCFASVPPSPSLYPPLALISGHHSLLQAHSNIWRLVKYAQCLPFCRLCPCQRRRTALMPFKRNTTRITSLPHTHTHTHRHTRGYSIEMSSCKISYGQPCDICARCQLPLMAARTLPPTECFQTTHSLTALPGINLPRHPTPLSQDFTPHFPCQF